MRNTVAHQVARIRSAAVRNGQATIRGHHLRVKIHQPLAADIPSDASQAVGGVTGGAREAGVDVARVLIPTRIADDLAR